MVTVETIDVGRSPALTANCSSTSNESQGRSDRIGCPGDSHWRMRGIYSSSQTDPRNNGPGRTAPERRKGRQRCLISFIEPTPAGSLLADSSSMLADLM